MDTESNETTTKAEERLKKFCQLKAEVKIQKSLDQEELDPQIKQAVLDLRDKGYRVDPNSGFWGRDPGDRQVMIINEKLEQSITETLRNKGFEVETTHNGQTFIKFFPENPDMQEITDMWNGVSACIPDKNENGR